MGTNVSEKTEKQNRTKKKSNGKNENKEKGSDYDSGLPLRKETRKGRRNR